MNAVEPMATVPHDHLVMRSKQNWSAWSLVAAAMLAGVPAAAAPAAGASPSVVTAVPSAVSATQPGFATGQPIPAPAASTAGESVARFYAGRQNGLLWLREGPHGEVVSKLLTILRGAEIDGFAGGPQFAAQAEAALAKAQSGNIADIKQAELLLATSWVLYVQALHRPTPGMIYGDLAVAPIVPHASRILQQAVAAPSLTLHLDAVSRHNPVYAGLREAALSQSDPALAVPDTVLRANLDRVRALPARGRFVLVDVATARLWMYEDGRPVGSMKVIVGTNEFKTPMIASMIHYTVLNPYWHVPDHLVRKTVAQGVLKQGPKYLEQRGYEVLSGWGPDAPLVSPAEVDWKAVARGDAKVIVRQLPGGANSMGRMKFPFANGEGIYLHDTPSKALFDKNQRDLSNGCIRLEDAPRFARWLLGREPVTSLPLPEQHVQLPKGVPVYVTYLTAHPADGKIVLAKDVYGWDVQPVSRTAALTPVADALAPAPPAAP